MYIYTMSNARTCTRKKSYFRSFFELVKLATDAYATSLPLLLYIYIRAFSPAQ